MLKLFSLQFTIYFRALVRALLGCFFLPSCNSFSPVPRPKVKLLAIVPTLFLAPAETIVCQLLKQQKAGSLLLYASSCEAEAGRDSAPVSVSAALRTRFVLHKGVRSRLTNEAFHQWRTKESKKAKKKKKPTMSGPSGSSSLSIWLSSDPFLWFVPFHLSSSSYLNVIEESRVHQWFLFIMSQCCLGEGGGGVVNVELCIWPGFSYKCAPCSQRQKQCRHTVGFKICLFFFMRFSPYVHFPFAVHSTMIASRFHGGLRCIPKLTAGQIQFLCTCG